MEHGLFLVPSSSPSAPRGGNEISSRSGERAGMDRGRPSLDTSNAVKLSSLPAFSDGTQTVAPKACIRLSSFVGPCGHFLSHTCSAYAEAAPFGAFLRVDVHVVYKAK